MGIPSQPNENNNNYRSGEHFQPSLRSILIRIPLLQNLETTTKIDVVNVNVPLLVALDALDKYKLFVHSVKNLLCCPDLSLAVSTVNEKALYI